MGWIVAYDVTCPKRWRRVHGRLGEVGFRLQYSLFWLPLGSGAGHALADQMAGLIDRRDDDMRFYPFPEGAAARIHGLPPWTPGVQDPLWLRFREQVR